MEYKITPQQDEQERQETIKKLAEQAKKERAKKLEEDKKKKLPPPKFYYDVKVECMLPATVTYRILAETPEKAAEMIKGMSPTSVKHKLIGRKELKLMVYDAGSNFIKLIKNIIK